MEEQLDYLVNFENYGVYGDLVRNGSIMIDTSTITNDNVGNHLDCILNIFRDGIEQPRVHNMQIFIRFVDNEEVKLSIFDYFINLIFWKLPLSVGDPITSEFLFYEEDITKSNIKRYIDDKFIDKHQTDTRIILLNQFIDDCLYYLKYVDEFSLYFLNTINNEDTIELMKSNPEFNECLHADLSGVPIESIKNVGMDYTNKAINIIKNSDHCLRDSFRAMEGINPKQFKEFLINVGSKPDGTGGVYPAIINSSFSNGGLSDVPSYFMESSTGRIALMMQKNNVGDSGHFSRILGLNNEQTRIHPDPHYKCNTKNLLKITIENADMLNRYKNRYYRFKPHGLDHKLGSNPVRDNKDLIGKTLYFRSPMTCASKSKDGICYACYGSLAYVNADINIGKIAAELLCSVLTQMLLSAKHLLESLVQALKWTEGFLDVFEVAFNIIGVKEDLENVKKYKLILDDIHSDDSDTSDDYVTSFEVQFPDGSIKTFRTENEDNIYLSKELQDIIAKDDSSVDRHVIPFDDIKDNSLFLVRIYNNELSKTLENVKTMINRANEVHGRDIHQWAQDFMKAIMDGGIDLDAVHAEVILSNQIRSKDDMLENPEWEYANEPYQLLTLNEALTNNPSVTVSLEYQKLPKALYYPLTFKKIKASSLDLFFMERPQDLMDIETVDPGIKSDKDIIQKAFTIKEEKPKKAFSFK